MELSARIYYQVEEGDTFYGIAGKFFSSDNVGIAKLLVLNEDFQMGLRDMSTVHIGEWIRVK